MSRKKGQTYTAKQKTKVVLELLKEEKTINQLATEFNVTSKTIQNWKKQFLENADRAFESDESSKAERQELTRLQEENDALAKTLGRTTVERDWAVGKLKNLDLSNKKILVDSKFTITKTRQCELIDLNRATLYAQPRPMNNTNLQILHKMDEIYTDNSDYGYRMIHQGLLEKGFSIGKDRVLKYMGVLGIQAIYPTKKRLTSLKHPAHKIYDYLLKPYWTKNGRTKSVYVPTANEVWSGDITYIRVNGGFMYLAAVIDWHTRAILAYKISNSMDATLATDVLEEALSKYPRPKIFNTDQGSQYTSYEHTKILKDNDIKISMNGRGRSIDNIMIERFFRTLKHSNIYISDYQNIKELKEGIKCFMHKYNYKRFHSSIGYQKPMNLYLKSIGKVA